MSYLNSTLLLINCTTLTYKLCIILNIALPYKLAQRVCKRHNINRYMQTHKKTLYFFNFLKKSPTKNNVFR